MKCGKPLVSDASIKCVDCIEDEPLFEYARSFGLYEGVLRKAVNLLKYNGIKRLAMPLSDVIPLNRMPRVDAVIPVPLYKKRFRQREFNQSAVLARYMAKRIGRREGATYGFPLLLENLVKVRDTKPQVGLSAKERAVNIKNAFEVKNNDLIANKNILLVDDVLTTGATVRECSRVLKKAGAGDVYVITLAHGVRDL